MHIVKIILSIIFIIDCIALTEPESGLLLPLWKAMELHRKYSLPN